MLITVTKKNLDTLRRVYTDMETQARRMIQTKTIYIRGCVRKCEQARVRGIVNIYQKRHQQSYYGLVPPLLLRLLRVTDNLDI